MKINKVNDDTVIRIPAGLFVLTTRNKEKDNFSINDSITIVNANPRRIIISCNNGSLNRDNVLATKHLNITAIGKKFPPELIKLFGTTSGKTNDKIKQIDPETLKRSDNGLYYITKNTLFVLSIEVDEVIKEIDHTSYIGDVIETIDLASGTQMLFEEGIKLISK